MRTAKNQRRQTNQSSRNDHRRATRHPGGRTIDREASETIVAVGVERPTSSSTRLVDNVRTSSGAPQTGVVWALRSGEPWGYYLTNVSMQWVTLRLCRWEVHELRGIATIGIGCLAAKQDAQRAHGPWHYHRN